MTNNITSIFKQDTISNYNDKITETLSKYTEKKVNKDKSVTYIEIPITYFLENNKWHIDFFKYIDQFKEQVENYKYSSKRISFPFNNENINKEMKFIVYNKIFSDEWKLGSTLRTQNMHIKRLAEFINEKYTNINSFKELDLEKANIQWIDWLNTKGLKIFKTQNIVGKDYETKTPIANYLEFIMNTFNTLTDEREEWEKDIWDVRNLDKYGITYNKSEANYIINFTKVDNISIREGLKKYIKQRLISNNKFSFSSARSYLRFLPNFLNYICELEPTWNDLKGLERNHILMYIEWLNVYTKENLTQKYANPKKYVVNV